MGSAAQKKGKSAPPAAAEPIPNARADAEPAAVWVDIAELRPWADNPRFNTGRPVDVVADSIRLVGWGRPLGACRGQIVWGHTARLAALKLCAAWTTMSEAQRRAALTTDDPKKRWHPEAVRTAETGRVPVRFRDDLTDRQAEQLALADNRTNELAEWDVQKLLDQLGDFDTVEVEAMGWNADDLQKLADDLLNAGEDEGPGEVEEDEAPEPPKDPITKPGDVWILGDHVLVCGDSTQQATVNLLMGGDFAPLVFTDPPYNVAGNNDIVSADVHKNMRKLKDAAWDQDFQIDRVLEQILPVLASDATVYVCTSHHLATPIWAWMKTWADHHSWCAWSKPNPMPSLMKRHWTWSGELICYATRGKHTFNFPDEGNAYSIWSYPIAQGKTGHPTEKPVKVSAHGISHSSRRGDIVLDLFGGSGSTLAACEQLGRRARLSELSPAYCDVIVERWQNLTGGKATRRAA